MPTAQFLLRLPFSADSVYAWHAREGALQRLLPPWEDIRVVNSSGSFESRRLTLRIRRAPLRVDWLARHHGAIPGRQFTDTQVKGPFARWSHTHTFIPTGPDSCELTDTIDYQLPLGSAGQSAGGWYVLRQLDRMFRFRHARTLHDLSRHAPYAERPRLRVAITGASGLIGSALSAFLTTAGHVVLPLKRSERVPDEPTIPAWNPETGQTNLARFAPCDAIIHLAGENISSRWTAHRKECFRASRVVATRLLCTHLAALADRPKTLISASATGYYGDRGDELLTETSPPGAGFLPELCRDWEEATSPAGDGGIRTVCLRIGVVLSPRGGFLRTLLPAFRCCLAGQLGSGSQYLSWLSLDDLLAIILTTLMNDRLRGPVNVVSATPVANRQFTLTLARILNRPAFLPYTPEMLEAAFGEMAAATVLASAKVLPAQLTEADFVFAHPTLESCLCHELGLSPLPPTAGPAGRPARSPPPATSSPRSHAPSRSSSRPR